MARRNVVTARGFVLNFEELVMKARRPMQSSNVDLKDKVVPQKLPSRQINVVGFVANTSGIAKPKQPNIAIPEPAPESPPHPSIADLTGVTVDASSRLKTKPDDPAAVANETLREIISDLDQFKTRDPVQDDSKHIKKS